MTALLLDPPASPIGSVSVTRAGALITGQSNAGFLVGFVEPWAHGILNEALAQMWGVERAFYNFNGWVGPDGWALQQGAIDHVFTTYGGTPLWEDGSDGAFLADNGGDPSTWEPGWAGQGVRNFVLNQLSADDRSRIPFIFWLHTESDTQRRTAADRGRYEAAARRWIALLRSWVGKGAAQLPVFAALPMPYDPATGEGHRTLRAAMHAMATDAGLNFRIGIRNTADCEPRDGNDGSHIDGPDLATWVRRLALGVGRWFRALYNHGPDAAWGGLGPRVVHAHAETATSTVLTVRHDRGGALRFRGGDKGADGRGWSVSDNGADRPVSAAAVIAWNKVRITHAACSGPAAARSVGYCLNGERLGRDGALYDDASSLPAPAGLGGDFAMDMPLAGTFLPVAASATAEGGPVFSIAIEPNVPGTVRAGADGIARWNTVVATAGGDAAEWRVQDAADVARFDWLPIGGTAAGAPLAVPFEATGDYLLVREPGNSDNRHSSFRATVEPFAGGGGGEPQPYAIDFAPRNPGTVPAAPDGTAEWTVTVTTAGGDAAEWAVFTAGNSARSGWNRLEGTAAGAPLRVPFLADGDYLVLREPGNDGLKEYSGQVSIGAATGGGGGGGAALAGAARASPSASATLGSREPGHYVRPHPYDPGTLYTSAEGGPARHAIQIESNGASRVGVAVVRSSDYGWRGPAEFFDVPPDGLNYAELDVFSGDFVKVFDADNFDVQENSAVFIVAVGGAGEGRSLSIEPNALGTVYEPFLGAGAPVTFTIKAAGVRRVGYVVMKSSDYSWRGAMTVVEDPPPSFQATVRIVASGDVIRVMDADDPGFATLSGLATVALDPAAGQPPDPADIAFAKAWTAPLAFGADLERDWAWNPAGMGTAGVHAVAAFLKGRGVDYVRLFYRWRPAVDMGDGTGLPTKEQFARILDAAAVYMSYGLKVILDCCDVLEAWNDFLHHEGLIYQHITNCAAWIAERNFDRNRFAVGPVNEWAGDDDYTVHQRAFHAILRAALPRFLLVCGSNGWKHYSRLIASRPFVVDGLTIWDFHSYDARTAAEWAAIADQISAWAAANGGLVCMWTEAGLGYAGWWNNGVYIMGQEDDPAAWVRNLAAMFPAMARFRPGVWAWTGGGFWRVNLSASDYALRPELDAPFAALVPLLRAELGIGADPDPGIEIPIPPELLGLFAGLDPFDTSAKIVLRGLGVAAQANFQAIGGFLGRTSDALRDATAEVISLRTAAAERDARIEALAARVAALEDA